MQLLKYITLPHVGTYKRRWVRRIMIIVSFPQEAARVLYWTAHAAAQWWKAP